MEDTLCLTMTRPPFRQNSKRGDRNNEKVCAQVTALPPAMFLSQLHCPLTRPYSVPVLWFAVYRLHETIPSLTAGILSALLISPRGLRPILDLGTILCGLSETRPGVLDTEAGLWKIPGQKLILSPDKYCTFYMQESFLLKAHTPVSWNIPFQLAQIVLLGQRNNPPPYPHHYYQVPAFCQYLGKLLPEGSVIFFMQMESSWAG